MLSFLRCCSKINVSINLVVHRSICFTDKNKPQGGGEATSEIQKQIQDVNVSTLIATITKLQQEKNLLQKERDELLAKLAATNGIQLHICIRVQLSAFDFFGDPVLLCFCCPISCFVFVSSAPEVITTKAAPAPITCPVDWHLFNNSCYFISRTTRDWPESQSYCQSQGGHLAIIHTAEEQVQYAKLHGLNMSLEELKTRIFNSAFVGDCFQWCINTLLMLRLNAFLESKSLACMCFLSDVSVGSSSQRTLERLLVWDH